MVENPLAQSFQLPISKRTLKNRIVKAPMTECMASASTNSPNETHVRLYEEWAKRSNAGALITGNVMVDRRYLESPNNVVVDDERDIGTLRNWASSVHKHECLLIAQISHPGRQCPMSVSFRPVAPSKGAGAVKMILPAFFPPRELRIDEIHQIREMFIRTALVFKKAGFDGVQIHSAHGYLLSQFLSPRFNQRKDAYGGSLENRTRLLREIIEGVKKTISNDEKFIICVKLNTADFQLGGFSEADSMEVISMLSTLGVDFVELSGGNYENIVFMQDAMKKRESTRLREAFFIDYVTKMRKHLNEKNQRIPVMLSGGFRHFSAMKEAIQSEEVDLIGIARPFCLEPEKIRELLDENRAAELCLMDANLGFKNRFLSALNSGIDNLWHQRQMWLLGQGKNPDFSITRVWILTGHVFYNYIFHPKRVSAKSWILSLGVATLTASLLYKTVFGGDRL